MNDKKSTNYRLSATARQLLLELANQRGITMTAMLEIIIRDYAAREKHHRERKG